MRIFDSMTDVPDKNECLPAAYFGSRWNPDINGYDHVQAVTFTTEHALERAVDLFWHDAALKGAPRIHVGDLTIFMPMEAVEILKSAGVDLTHSEVVSDEQPLKRRSNRKAAALSY
jgi:hypothetical protein